MRWTERQVAMLREIGVHVVVRESAEPAAAASAADVAVAAAAMGAAAPVARPAVARPPVPSAAAVEALAVQEPSPARPATTAAAAHWLVVVDASAGSEPGSDEAMLLANMLRAIGVDAGAGDAPRRSVRVEAAAALSAEADAAGSRIALAFGRAAAQSLLGRDEPIGQLRGQVHAWRGIPVIVTLAPSYLLRHPDDKAKAWADLCLAAATLDAVGGAERGA